MTWAPAGSMPPGERKINRVVHDLGSGQVCLPFGLGVRMTVPLICAGRVSGRTTTLPSL
jgi:hypothetical protein